jgi:hypothetical protein
MAAQQGEGEKIARANVVTSVVACCDSFWGLRTGGCGDEQVSRDTLPCRPRFQEPNSERIRSQLLYIAPGSRKMGRQFVASAYQRILCRRKMTYWICWIF